MKKIFAILTIVMVAFMTISCGAIKQSATTNTVFETTGRGVGSYLDQAWLQALDNAKVKVMQEFKGEIVYENETTYSQAKNGSHGSDRSTTIMKIRSFSEGIIYDAVVVKEKRLPLWDREGFRYGIELTVRVNPSNVQTCEG